MMGGGLWNKGTQKQQRRVEKRMRMNDEGSRVSVLERKGLDYQ